ncbi:hypothetical protein [Streptomyces mirabilis]|uniref:Lipoprotein n=1 Tax=Streptomyces mirabilis TaxID=68239 RepID=A0A1I2PR73_9ACTN|nr:hypothetical protein [Streptomyces mirabilis]SFG16096.1 hypothetical protein SAMN02787118_116182 [Streptomyces mirabilis]
MPFTLPPRTLSGPRRRSLLASAAGAFVLVGCSAPEPSTDTPVRSPSAADRARARAARDSESLAARYAAVITAHPALAARLKPLRAEVVRHAQAFGGSKTAGSRPSASGSPSPSASAHPSPSPTVPVQERDALADLATAERTLADQRTKALLTVPGELARLLASVAAAGAAHAFLLTEGAK